MKLAIVNPTGSTEGWRYAEFLLKGLMAADPALDITFYYNKQWIQTTGSENMRECIKRLGALNIRLSTEQEAVSWPFNSTQKFKNKYLNRLWNFLRKIKFHRKHHGTIRDFHAYLGKDLFEGYDLVFYSLRSQLLKINPNIWGAKPNSLPPVTPMILPESSILF